jgi:hypothetical protein
METAMSPALPTSTSNRRTSRGKEHIGWSEEVWQALDHAVMEEMRRTRVAAKFLPHFQVGRRETNIAADTVVIPSVPTQPGVVFDPALSSNESTTVRIQEYWTNFKLSVAQVEAEGHEERAPTQERAAPSHQTTTMPPREHESAEPRHLREHKRQLYRVTTPVSLSLRCANILAQAEDLILFNGQNAVQNSPLFQGLGQTSIIQALDPSLLTDIDFGLLQINPLFPGTTGNVITLPPSQVVLVHPVPPPSGTPTFPPRYAENTLNAVATAFTQLQALQHYEGYAAAFNTIPFADMHEALATTLIEPVEPIAHIIKAGIYGTGTLPPFSPITGPVTAPLSPSLGLPTHILKGGVPQPVGTILNFTANVLYTGVVVCLNGNTMDLVRGQMDNELDAIVTFNQKDQNEQYRFRVVHRFALRLKDPTAVMLLLFLDG